MYLDKKENLLTQKLKEKLVRFKSSYALFVQEGSKIWSHATGCGKNSQFMIASLSKQMTCLMFLKALQKMHPRQKLANLINKTLLEVFPDSATVKLLNKEWLKSITIYQITSNRSGLTWSKVMLDKYHTGAAFDPKIALKEAVEFNAAMVNKFEYSGFNYFLLAELIKEMTQMSYGQAFKELITKSARMASSHALEDFVSVARKDKAFKNLVDDPMPAAYNMIVREGSSNIVSTPADLLRWNNYLHNKLEAKFKEIMMLKSPRDTITDYSMGLIHNKNNDCVWHYGIVNGFKSWIGYSRGLNIVILSNDSNRYPALVDVVQEILLNA